MILFDTNVLLDIATADPVWLPWSEKEFQTAAAQGPILINPIIYAELAPAFANATDLDRWLDPAVFIGFGERGRSAEEVGRQAVSAAKTWIEADVPVDEHLADQLLLPTALAGGGAFRTSKPSLHATTNAAVIQRFLPVAIGFEQENAMVWSVNIGTG